MDWSQPAARQRCLLPLIEMSSDQLSDDAEKETDSVAAEDAMQHVEHLQAKFLHQHQGDVVKCFFRSLGSSTDAKKIQAD